MTRSGQAELDRRQFLSLAVVATASLRVPQTTPGSPLRFLRYDDVEAIVRSQGLRLPQELEGLDDRALRQAWPKWVEQQDAELAARLQRGEEDTLANFVLFGVSFTPQPRLTPEVTDADAFDRVLRLRIQDFADAAARPRSERLQQLGALITQLGHSAAAGEARERLSEYVMQDIERYLTERQEYGSQVTRSLGNDTDSAFSVTSEIYKDRGLSVDTDFRPNYAIETALTEARDRGVLRSVRRVAILGPGLDFTDKDSGFDHYPLQTLQPFAVVDSLLKLGMAGTADLQVSLFDVSKTVLNHVSGAVARARDNQPYTVQMVLDRSRGWKQPVLEYWRSFGAKIGSETTPIALPSQLRAAGDFQARAITIRPEIVRLLEPVSMNAVLQRMELPSDRRFDLVVGTNIFVYYPMFQQALALTNVDALLAADGVFLTNDLTQELPGSRLRPGGIVRAEYTGTQADQVCLYIRSRFQLQLPPV